MALRDAYARWKAHIPTEPLLVASEASEEALTAWWQGEITLARDVIAQTPQDMAEFAMLIEVCAVDDFAFEDRAEALKALSSRITA